MTDQRWVVEVSQHWVLVRDVQPRQLVPRPFQCVCTSDTAAGPPSNGGKFRRGVDWRRRGVKQRFAFRPENAWSRVRSRLSKSVSMFALDILEFCDYF